MGLLVDGTWHDVWYDTKASQGRFVRTESQYRNWITADGSAGPSGGAGFRAEPGRYHLYVAFACPWAHRTLIMRELKGLDADLAQMRGRWLRVERANGLPSSGVGGLPRGRGAKSGLDGRKIRRVKTALLGLKSLKRQLGQLQRTLKQLTR